MQVVTSVGKNVTSTMAKRGKTWNQCQARENVQPVQAREKKKNMQPAPSAGKHATTAKRGKICEWCQARENIQPVSSAGKSAQTTSRWVWLCFTSTKQTPRSD